MTRPRCLTSSRTGPRRGPLAWLAVGLIGLNATVASAAPINYSEAVSGDLGDLPVSLGVLDAGANVISGFWSTTPNSVNGDFFRVDLDTGFQIDSIVVSYALDNGEVVNSGVYQALPTFNSIGSGAGTFTGPFSSAGQYEAGLAGSVIFDNTAWSVTFNVSRTSTVPPNDVPAPGSLALLTAGLIGLAATRRRAPR